MSGQRRIEHANGVTMTGTVVKRGAATERGAAIRRAAAGLLLLVAACGGGGEETEGRTGETDVVVLAPGDLAEARLDTLDAGVVVTGTLEPYLQVEVRAQVPGVVTNLAVDRGDAVRRGQPLARIEAEGIRGQAASARAAVASAEANLALARRQHDSSRRLFEAGAMSEIEFQQAVAGLEAAQAQLAAARAQALGAGETARRATVEAPIAGVVSDRMISEGEAVNPATPLLTIVNTSQLELAGRVGVEQAAQIRAGMPVALQINAYPGRTFSGAVARVDPTANPDTRQVGVYVRLPNAGSALVGGVFATGRVLTGGQTPVLTVPSGAVRGTETEPFVWAIEDGRVVRRLVQLGARSEAQRRVEIVSGLEPGAVVVATPGQVTEGQQVRIRSEESPGVVTEEEQ